MHIKTQDCSTNKLPYKAPLRRATGLLHFTSHHKKKTKKKKKKKNEWWADWCGDHATLCCPKGRRSKQCWDREGGEAQASAQPALRSCEGIVVAHMSLVLAITCTRSKT
mmetsp:Transcript_45520/g.97584  ORF Transcript_45520/g.97584 Transcript_45520/m.97584 type:complete len:109 (-) Transcript_45520:2-328(-)